MTQTWLVLAAEPTNVVEWFQDSSQRVGSGAIPQQLWITLWHSLAATSFAIAFAVPIALVLAHYRKAELLSAWVVNIGRVIPTVTIIGVVVLVSLRNGYGFEPWPILIALVAMALPPIFSNTYTAIRGVDENVVGAARAIGMRERSIMGRVELPLGLAVIVAGVRVAAVQVVATEVIGAFFGGEGLGAYIRQGIGNNDIYEVQGGALLITATAMSVDLSLWLISKALVPRSQRRKHLSNQPEGTSTMTITRSRWRGPLLLLAVIALLLSACGENKSSEGASDTPGSASEATLRLRPQDFAESVTLTEVYAQFLEAKGFQTEVQKADGAYREGVYPALTANKADIVIDYSGSAATYLDPKGTPSPDQDKTYNRLTAALNAKKFQAAAYSGAEDKNALVVLKSFAEKNGLTKISDLAKVQDQVVFGGSAQCIERADCLLGYQDAKYYGLKFKSVKTLEYGPPLAAGLESGDIQAAQYQTTAPEIASGKFVVLEDDKGLLSADNIVPIFRIASGLDEDVIAALNEISEQLTTEDLIGWNVATDINKEEPADVAAAWLKDKGLN